MLVAAQYSPDSENRVGSYYRARYCDSNLGRFASQDPIGFGGGSNFYEYVFNRAVQMTDAMGLTPHDVGRIQASCLKCTKSMTDQGYRADASNGFWGHWNDLTTWWTKRWGCKDQAWFVKQGCLDEDAFHPYDDHWTFEVVYWPLNNHIVRGTSSNPNDPIVYCDPWRNATWTAPRVFGDMSPGPPL